MEDNCLPKEFVSVLIASNRVDGFLINSLESSFRALQKVEGELILSLDGIEEDYAIQRLSLFVNQNRNLVISKSPGSGLVDALNYGLSLATGELIARMDADDIMLPNRLQIQRDKFQENQELVLLGGAIHLIDEFGARIRKISYPTGDRHLRKMLQVGCYFAHPATMYRKSAVLSVGGYRSKYLHAEDYDLWMRLCRIGEIENLNETLILYRSHSNQISNKHRSEQERSTAGVIAEFSSQKKLWPAFLNFRIFTRRLLYYLNSMAIQNPRGPSFARRLVKFVNHPILTWKQVMQCLKDLYKNN